MWNLFFRYHIYVCALMIISVFLRRRKIQWIIWLIEFVFDVNIERCGNLVTWKIFRLPYIYLLLLLGNIMTDIFISFVYRKKKRITAIWDLFKRKKWPWKQEWLGFGAWLSTIRNLFFCIRSSCDCILWSHTNSRTSA